MDDNEIRRLLSDAPRLSFVSSPPGFAAINRDRIAESHGEPLAQQVDAWVERAGGHQRAIEQPVSRGLRAGRRLVPTLPRPAVVWYVPAEALKP